MGPRNSKQSQLNFMKDYTVIQQIQTENITYLQHKKTQDQYLLKQFNFNDKKQCEKMMDKLAQLKNKLNDNKHVVPLKDYLMSAEDQYCSTFYKIYALFAYPQRTLDDQINQRKLHRKKFTQTQLWSILASCIVGLSHLQKNGIKHSAIKSNNILLSRQGVIKIADPFSIGQCPNYDSVFTKRSSSHIYLSPEQTQALQQEVISPVINPYKSDIFTLGMIMLEAGLLQYQDEQCYRDQKSRIHWQTVHYNINRLGQAYSDEIKNMVQFMLSKDERARPDWCDLQQHVMKGGDDVRRSFIEGQNRNYPNTENLNTLDANKSVALHAHKGRINTTQVNNNLTNVPNINIPKTSEGNLGRYSPRTSTNPNNIPPPLINNTILVGNAASVRYPRPESPRVSSNTNPNNYNQPYIPPSLNTYTYNKQNPVILPSTTYPSQNIHIPTYPTPYSYQQTSMLPTHLQTQHVPSYSSIPPLKISNIDHIRPAVNIFPTDKYIIKTKFDENLIIMTEGQDQTEQNYSNSFNQQMGNVQMQNKINQYRLDAQQTFNPRQYSQINQLDSSKDRTSSYHTGYGPQSINFSNQNPFNKQSNQYIQHTQNLQYVPSQPRPQTYQPPQIHHPTKNYIPQSQYSTNVNSQLKFITQQFKMGSRYQGYKLNGLRHGYGKFYYQDGGMYDGNWHENKMQGFGKLFYQSGKLAYQGQWNNDQFAGKGILYNQIPQILNHGFNYNNFDDVQEYWVKYQGQFLDDMKNGRGILYLSNGQIFQGNFVGDGVQGHGVFYCNNGQKVNGNWSANVKVG